MTDEFRENVDQVLLARLEQAAKNHEELLQKTEFLYESLGITPQEAKKILDHATLQDWNKLNRRAKELDHELLKGRLQKIRSLVFARKKKVKKKKGKSKGRLLGRRKGWIDMH